MRILVVTHDYPPPPSGGYAAMAADVCDGLVARGHRLDVLTQGEAGVVGPRRRPRRPQVHRALRTYYEDGECVFPPLSDAADIERHNLAQLERVIAQVRPDLISFWHMGPISLNLISEAIERGYPIVFVIGDDWLVYGAWADGWHRRFLPNEEPEIAEEVARETGLRTTLPDLEMAGHFCFVSEYTRERARGKTLRAYAASSIVPPGLPESFFTNREPIQEWNDELLWVGRLTKTKGIYTALEALTLMSDEVRLRAIGPAEPSEFREIEAFVRHFGLERRVSFECRDRAAMPVEYSRAPVTLFTSEIEHEAFGMTALEAMSRGSGVISTAVGGSAEFCRNGWNCVTVQPGDAHALNAAIRHLWDNPERRRRLRRNGLATAARYTLARQVDALEEIMTRAAGFVR